MSLDPMPGDVVVSRLRIQKTPEIGIFDRLLIGRAPTFGLPVRDPLCDAVYHVATICIEIHCAPPLERLKRSNRRGQLHAVVGSVCFAAKNFFSLIVVKQNRSPATGPWIAAASTIRIDPDATGFSGTLRHSTP